MPKAYWMSLRIQIHDADKMKAYAEKAGPAIAAGGGKFLARGGKVKTLEGFEQGRVVIIEFPDFDTAVSTYHSPAYEDAHSHILGGAVERDTFIVEGVEDELPRGDLPGPVAYWIGAHMTIHDDDKMAEERVKILRRRQDGHGERTTRWPRRECVRVALRR